MQRRVYVVLAALAIVAPTLGLAVNLAWPPARYGYQRELYLLMAVWTVAFLLAYPWPRAAVVFYCVAALVPVGMTLQYYQGIGGGFSVLMLTPLVGIAIVTALTQHERAIVAYGLVALVVSLVFGQVGGDMGQGGALAFLCGALTACALWWTQACNLKAQLMEIGDRQKSIDSGLNRITGKLGK